MKRPSLLAGLVCLVSLSGVAQTPPEAPEKPKPAWQWTDEERLAARFAPGSAAERLAAMTAPSARRYPESRGPEPRFRDVVDGRRDPQLFMPLEVFGHLVRLVARPGQPPPSPGEQRFIDELLAQAPSNHLPPDFRAILERETVPYLDIYVRYLEEAANRRARPLPSDNQERDERLRTLFKSTGRDACRALHLAMARVRSALGADGSRHLLEFLYKEVAPRMVILYESNAESHEVEVRDFIGGCQ